VDTEAFTASISLLHGGQLAACNYV